MAGQVISLNDESVIKTSNVLIRLIHVGSSFNLSSYCWAYRNISTIVELEQTTIWSCNQWPSTDTFYYILVTNIVYLGTLVSWNVLLLYIYLHVTNLLSDRSHPSGEKTFDLRTRGTCNQSYHVTCSDQWQASNLITWLASTNNTELESWLGSAISLRTVVCHYNPHLTV